MKKIRKKLLATLALSCLFVVGAGAFAACDGGEEDTGKITATFYEECEVEFALGDEIKTKDYIPVEILNFKDANGKKGYKLEIKQGNVVVDLTDRPVYQFEEMGDWTLILTVGDSKAEMTLTVGGRPLTWILNKPESVEFSVGDVINLTEFKEDLIQDVVSDFAYETYFTYVSYSTATESVRMDIKTTESFTFESANVHLFEFVVEATDGQRLSDTFFALPKTDEVRQYVKRNTTEYPFRDIYGATSLKTPKLKPEIATDGFYVDHIDYEYDAELPDRYWAGMKANSTLFKKYFDKGAEVIKFDVYNDSERDHTYSLFQNLNEDALPEGSKGTLTAKSWTTISVTKAMIEEAMAKPDEDYKVDEKYDWKERFGRYGWSSNKFPFTVALDNGGTARTATYYLDNVRVEDSQGAVTKVTLLEQEEPTQGGGIEANFYASSKETLFSAVYQNAQTPEKYEDDLTYIKEGDSSWKVEMGDAGTKKYAGLAFNWGNGYENNLDTIFADQTVTSFTFDVYNAHTADIAYCIGYLVYGGTGYEKDGVKRVEGTLTAGAWTTVTITREAFEGIVTDLGSKNHDGDIVFACNDNPAATLYFDNFQVVKTA